MDYLSDLTARYPALAVCENDIKKAFEILSAAFEKGGALLLCGNGGSAADCGHIAGELAKGFVKKRPLSPEAAARLDGAPEAYRAPLRARLAGGLPAISLCEHGALLSAVINDTGADFMFAQQVAAYAALGGAFLGISTSGNAKNVLYAAASARAFGLATVALTGGSGGELARLCDAAIIVPAAETYKIQEYHLPVYHALCLALEERFFPC